MDDYSYGQAYADWQAELRQSAARVSAARRQRKSPVRGRLGRRRARTAYRADGVSAASRPASMP